MEEVVIKPRIIRNGKIRENKNRIIAKKKKKNADTRKCIYNFIAITVIKSCARSLPRSLNLS